MDLETIRREYLLGGLNREDLQPSPITQFQTWLEQAIASELPDPSAMVLATADADGMPSQRIVLLKHLDEDGLVFYTNYQSLKAQDMAHNPRVSVLFPWYMMERQVKICGRAEKVSAEQSQRYFASRPEESRLAAWASPQSRMIESRQSLLDQFDNMKQRFQHNAIPCPEFWGGYRIRPHLFEFWQGRANRLHDRFEYRLEAEQNWVVNRLAP